MRSQLDSTGPDPRSWLVLVLLQTWNCQSENHGNKATSIDFCTTVQVSLLSELTWSASTATRQYNGSALAGSHLTQQFVDSSISGSAKRCQPGVLCRLI